MRRQAVPDLEWQRRRTVADTVRLIRDFVLGALFLGGLLAFIFYVLLFWNPS